MFSSSIDTRVSELSKSRCSSTGAALNGTTGRYQTALSKIANSVEVGAAKNNFTANSDTNEIISDIQKNGALIIDKPWINLIFSGQKTWEMRTTKFKKVGYIGLVQKGSKSIIGIAKIEGYSEKLTLEELKKSEDKHRVPEYQYSAASYKWFYAMKLTDVVRLSQPVIYEHKNGTVIWVTLSDQKNVVDKIRTELNKTLIPDKGVSDNNIKPKKARTKVIKPKIPIVNATESKAWLKELKSTSSIVSKTGMLPVCKNGHKFSSCNGMRDGLYHLKDGSREYRFEKFQDAVSALKKDETLKWAYFTPDGKRLWKETASWQKIVG